MHKTYVSRIAHTYKKNLAVSHKISFQTICSWFLTRSLSVTFAGCWAHSRWRFSDALKALPKEKKANEKETIAYQALKQIAAIYHQDNELSELEPYERQKLRQLTVKPLVEAYFTWAKDIKRNQTLTQRKNIGRHCLYA